MNFDLVWLCVDPYKFVLDLLVYIGVLDVFVFEEASLLYSLFVFIDFWDLFDLGLIILEVSFFLSMVVFYTAVVVG